MQLENNFDQWHDTNPEEEEELTPVLITQRIDGKVSKYVIIPKETYDPERFLSMTSDEVIALFTP
jgi:hypothetical protein